MEDELLSILSKFVRDLEDIKEDTSRQRSRAPPAFPIDFRSGYHGSVSALEDIRLADSLRTLASRQPGLKLLALFGSRARGDSSPLSDWDFGLLADPPFDLLATMAALAERVGSERVDLVDLARAGGLLRYRAARDGALVYEATPGLFDRFRIEALRFWYDAEVVLLPGYEAILERMG